MRKYAGDRSPSSNLSFISTILFKFLKPRVALLVDMDNISISVSNETVRPDFLALWKYANKKGRLLVADLFAVRRLNAEFGRTTSLLKGMGYSINLIEPNNSRNGTRKQAPVDQALAARALAIASKYKVSRFILATGDGDFVPVVKELQSCGIHVTVVGPDRCTAKTLRTAADKTIYFSKVGLIKKVSRRGCRSKSNTHILQ